MRARETPEETKARHRASLLSDLPELPEEGQRRPAQRRAAADDAEPDIPKVDAAAESAARSGQTPPTDPPPGSDDDTPPGDPNDDPFADIHWNDDQTTFTIRL